MAADPGLLAIWTRGWAATRGVGPPVRDGAAWRIEVGAPDQVRRFVFDRMGPEVGAMAASITEPLVFLKVCAEASEVLAGLGPRWSLRPAGHLMRLERPMPSLPETDGPAPEVTREGGVIFARLRMGGEVIAEGRAARIDDHV